MFQSMMSRIISERLVVFESHSDKILSEKDVVSVVSVVAQWHGRIVFTEEVRVEEGNCF